METKKDIEEYNREWAAKGEKDSAILFDIAEEALRKKPKKKVIFVKRLSRFDPVPADPKGIKQKLSNFANSVYEQLWFKRGGIVFFSVQYLRLCYLRWILAQYLE